MKTVKSIFASFILIALVSVSAVAGTGSKVIAVVNNAEWCPTCQKHGMRAMETFKAINKDMAIQFIANDLTDDESKKKSAEALEEVGLNKAMADHKGTGVVYFFDAESKELINKVSVAKTNEELAEAVATAKRGKEYESDNLNNRAGLLSSAFQPNPQLQKVKILKAVAKDT
jgi:thiol-disulfide isomerase/thioredoxin